MYDTPRKKMKSMLPLSVNARNIRLLIKYVKPVVSGARGQYKIGLRPLQHPAATFFLFTDETRKM